MMPIFLKLVVFSSSISVGLKDSGSHSCSHERVSEIRSSSRIKSFRKRLGSTRFIPEVQLQELFCDCTSGFQENPQKLVIVFSETVSESSLNTQE
jgi:hypothetical protein